MPLENGDLIFTNNGSPYCGYTEGPARIAQAIEGAAQVSGSCCALSPDAALAAFGHSAGPYLEVFNTATWASVGTLSQPPGSVNGLAFSPDGSKLAVAHSTTPFITIYETTTWTKLTSPATLPTGAGNAVAWSPDGGKLAVAHTTAPRLTVYNVASWSKMADPATPPASTGNGVSFSPDGSKIAVAVQAAPLVRIFNAADLSNAASEPSLSSAGQGYAIAYSPNGNRLAFGVSGGAYLRIFNTADWSSLAVPSIGGAVYGLAWITDDEIAVASANHPRLTVVDVPTATKQVRSFVGNTCFGVAAKRYTPKMISGTIIDANGNGIARTVRAYRRDTGELVGQTVSNPTTGAYSIKCRYFVECDVVMLDDAAGTIENDQILRTTPV